MQNFVVVHGPAGSSYVRSTCLTLEEKGVAYRLEQQPIPAYKQEPWLSERQPFGKVPAFEHDGFRLYETQAILRYIDEAFPGPKLQPENPRARARMNQIIGIVDAYFWPSAAAGIVWNRLIAPRNGFPADEALVAAAVPRARLCLAEFERLMGDGPYLVGDRVTLADLMVLPILPYLEATPEGEEMLRPRERLRSWVERMKARESARQVLAAA